MISYAFEYPSSWTTAMANAVQRWPTTVCSAWTDGETSGSPTLHSWFRDEPLAALPLPEAPGAVTAMVIGRHPMRPARLTEWFRRVAELICDAGDLVELAAVRSDDATHRVALPVGTEAAPVARSSVRSFVADLERVDDLVLLASELATNAVLHAGGAQELVVRRGPDAVVIEMTDHRAALAPVVRRGSTLPSSGRGMSMIDSMADHWGMSVGVESKTVWCEVLVGRHARER